MMQSQGLGALMPQGAQQMAPPQQQQSPMDPQRLAAATNLVSSDAERQVLDPRTLALIKYKDAVAAMQAADELMVASQPPPTPPTVAERVQQSAQEGIMGLASRLGAGIQQQGGNMQAQQMQQAMSGGLPQLPAPNMAGMAQGGIVGYQDGGLLRKGASNNLAGSVDLLSQLIQKRVDRLKEQGVLSEDEYSAAQKSITAGARSTEGKLNALLDMSKMLDGLDAPSPLSHLTTNTPAPQDMAQGGIVGYQDGGDVLTPEEIALRNREMAALLSDEERDLDETSLLGRLMRFGSARRSAQDQKRLDAEETARRNREAATRAFGPPIPEGLEPAAEAVPEEAAPTVEGTIAPFDLNLSSLDKFNLPTEPTAPTAPTAPTMPAAQAETAPAAAQPSRDTAGLEAMLEQIQGQTFDPEAAAGARSEELRRLTGADDLMSQRAEAERSRRELAESRFSPEERRRRALQAGLAGLAQRGLGGFSAGATAEEERIYAEQMGESERSVAEMDRMIADLRARGMTEFEARNTARALMQERQDTQRQQQVEVLSALTQDDRQRAQIAMQETVARIQAESGQFKQSINILTRAGRTEEEALQEITAMTQRAQADPADARWQNAVNTAYEQIAADSQMMAKSEEERFEAAERLAIRIYKTSMRRPGAGGGGTGLGELPDDDLFNF